VEFITKRLLPSCVNEHAQSKQLRDGVYVLSSTLQRPLHSCLYATLVIL